MEKNRKQLLEQYDSYPARKKEYETDGKKYTVVRHFTADKSIDRVIEEIAVNRANREMGL